MPMALGTPPPTADGDSHPEMAPKGSGYPPTDSTPQTKPRGDDMEQVEGRGRDWGSAPPETEAGPPACDTTLQDERANGETNDSSGGTVPPTDDAEPKQDDQGGKKGDSFHGGKGMKGQKGSKGHKGDGPGEGCEEGGKGHGSSYESYDDRGGGYDDGGYGWRGYSDRDEDPREGGKGYNYDDHGYHSRGYEGSRPDYESGGRDYGTGPGRTPGYWLPVGWDRNWGSWEGNVSRVAGSEAESWRQQWEVVMRENDATYRQQQALSGPDDDVNLPLREEDRGVMRGDDRYEWTDPTMFNPFTRVRHPMVPKDSEHMFNVGEDDGMVHIRNLPPHADRLWLYTLFAPFGALNAVRCQRTPGGGKCIGWGNVFFQYGGDAKIAIKKMNLYNIDGRTLTVQHGRGGPGIVSASGRDRNADQREGRDRPTSDQREGRDRPMSDQRRERRDRSPSDRRRERRDRSMSDHRERRDRPRYDHRHEGRDRPMSDRRDGRDRPASDRGRERRDRSMSDHRERRDRPIYDQRREGRDRPMSDHREGRDRPMPDRRRERRDRSMSIPREGRDRPMYDQRREGRDRPMSDQRREGRDRPMYDQREGRDRDFDRSGDRESHGFSGHGRVDRRRGT